MKFLKRNAFCILNDSTLGSFYKNLSQLAETNTWQHRRNLFADSAFTTGLAGFTIRADSSDATFCLTLRNNEGFNYDYSHLDLFNNENQWF
nr:hypothetical protein [Bacteroidota bacterium]